MRDVNYAPGHRHGKRLCANKLGRLTFLDQPHWQQLRFTCGARHKPPVLLQAAPLKHLVRVDPVLARHPRNRHPVDIRLLHDLEPLLSTPTPTRPSTLTRIQLYFRQTTSSARITNLYTRPRQHAYVAPGFRVLVQAFVDAPNPGRGLQKSEHAERLRTAHGTECTSGLASDCLLGGNGSRDLCCANYADVSPSPTMPAGVSGCRVISAQWADALQGGEQARDTPSLPDSRSSGRSASFRSDLGSPTTLSAATDAPARAQVPVP